MKGEFTVKSKEELTRLKSEMEELSGKLSALNDDELAEVVGGLIITNGRGGNLGLFRVADHKGSVR